MPTVNSRILTWARETAGLSLEEAAEKLDLPAGASTPAKNLYLLEKGDDDPPRQLLVKMSKLYRRPLLSFYLSAPPRTGDRGEDFRTLPQRQFASANVLVDALIRDVRARQRMVRSALEDEGETTRLPFVASVKISDGIGPLVISISNKIGVNTREYQAAASPDDAFARLRTGAEAAGIFVMLIGNLGSYHTAIDVEVFRGFALADDVAPFVIVNDLDARPAWSFTLIHELAHLWLGATGVSGAYADTEIEQFCNDVASELLLPEQQLRGLDVSQATDLASLSGKITGFASGKNLSSTMVAYRLYRSGVIPWDIWERLRSYFRTQWLTNRDKNRALAREAESGADYYVVRRHRVGNALIEFARRTMAGGILTPTKAGKVLGVKPLNVHALIGTPASRG